MTTTNVPNDLKKSLYDGLKAIKTFQPWDGKNQPWLNPPESFLRRKPGTPNANRVGMNGKTRNLTASDMGTVVECERSFAATYAGVNIGKQTSNRVYRGKGGTMLHAAIEIMLPEEFVTESSEKKRVGRERTWVTLPTIGARTNLGYNGKKSDGPLGKIDGYLPNHQTGLEIKTIPRGERFPDVLPQKYIGQAAGYTIGYRHDIDAEWKPKYWAWIFLSQDLRDLDPGDTSTYRVFIESADDLMNYWYRNVIVRAKFVAKYVDAFGYEKAVDNLPCHRGKNCDFCN